MAKRLPVRPGSAVCVDRLDAVRGVQVVVLAEAVEQHRGARPGGDAAHLGKVAAGDHLAVRRHQLDQPSVGVQQRLGRRVEVGVVVLDAGQHQGLGAVVEELRPAVEVGGVVLVALDHEAVAAAGAEADAEVAGHAADQEARLGAAVGEHPGGQRGGGGLAVGAGHHQRPAAGEEEAAQGLRHRVDRQPAALRLHRLGIVAAHRVAHHHQVRRRLEVGRVPAHPRYDAGVGEQRAHRRVERLVGAPHGVALLLQQASERRHAAPPDGDQVDGQLRRLGHRERRLRGARRPAADGSKAW